MSGVPGRVIRTGDSVKYTTLGTLVPGFSQPRNGSFPRMHGRLCLVDIWGWGVCLREWSQIPWVQVRTCVLFFVILDRCWPFQDIRCLTMKYFTLKSTWSSVNDSAQERNEPRGYETPLYHIGHRRSTAFGTNWSESRDHSWYWNRNW